MAVAYDIRTYCGILKTLSLGKPYPVEQPVAEQFVAGIAVTVALTLHPMPEGILNFDGYRLEIYVVHIRGTCMNCYRILHQIN